MGKTAILAIRIISDHKQAAAGMEATAGSADKMDGAMRRASQGAAVLLGGLAVIAKQTADAASALQQAEGSVESVYGHQSEAVMDLARGAATAVGLSTSAYAEIASVLGAQLRNMGLAEDELVGTTDTLIRMGADLAATFGGTTADAVDALSSLFRGEADPIERYGVTIKQADVNARLAAMGLDELEGSALRAAETQARLALLTEQTATSTGQFARETDTAAVAQQIATATMEDAKAALGVGLLPLIVLASQAIAVFAQFTAENSNAVSFLAIVLGTAAGAFWLLNFAMSANPVAIVIGLVAALVAGLIVAYNQSESFRNVVNSIGDALLWLIGGISDALGWLGELVGVMDSVDGRSVNVSTAQSVTTSYLGGPAAEPAALMAGPARTASAPADMLSTASARLLAAPSLVAAASAGGAGGNVTHNHHYSLSVQGHVVDRQGAGRAIEQLLTEARRANGQLVGTAAGSWG